MTYISNGLCCDMSKTKQLGLIFVLIATSIGFIWGIWKGQQKSLDYKKNGVEITCTVMNVSSFRNKQNVVVEYQQSGGNVVRATCIANRKVSLGETFNGYVLPGKPSEVFCPPSKLLMAIAYLLVGVIELMAITGIVVCIKNILDDRKLVKYGIHTRGRVISFKKEDKIFFGSVQFTDSKGTIHVTEIPFIKIKPRTGNDYDIIYMVEANGKCYAKLKQDL